MTNWKETFDKEFPIITIFHPDNVLKQIDLKPLLVSFISTEIIEKLIEEINLKKKSVAGTDIGALGHALHANGFNEAVEKLKGIKQQLKAKWLGGGK